MNLLWIAALGVSALISGRSAASPNVHLATASADESSCYRVDAVTIEDDAPRAVLGNRTLFHVRGEGLPGTLAFFIEQCTDPRPEPGNTSTDAVFSCKPSYSVGVKRGVVKPYPNAPIEFKFDVEVEGIE